MNPAQPNVPDARELCFWALEQAYANSLATEDKMQKQINGTNGKQPSGLIEDFMNHS